VLLVATGSLVPECLEAAEALSVEGTQVTVVDPRWLVPVPESLVGKARDGFDLVATVEDGILEGGFGWAVRDALEGADVPVLTLGIPRSYLSQARRSAIQVELGLDAVGIAATIGQRVRELTTRRTPDTTLPTVASLGRR